MEEEPRKMSKKEFWIRFALWLVFALAVPFAYICIEYGIFAPATSKSLSGWGVLAIIFACIVAVSVIREAKRGLPYDSMIRQCIEGYSALIWLLGFILIIHRVKANMDDFERFLIITLASEVIAVPINPMRKWGMQHNIERTGNFLVKTIKKAIGKEE